MVQFSSITPKNNDTDNLSQSSSSASSSVADSEPNEPVEMFVRSKNSNSNAKQQHLNLEIENCDGESVDSEKAYRVNGNNRNAKGNRSTSPSLTKVANGSHNTYEKESVSGNPGSSGGGRKQKGSTIGRETGLDLSPKQDDLY